ncbi:MAG: hypothetical protein K2M80_02275, partial [Muribaculaceae bacterium]|nr:hypothetical protein [Muribaculaceae bacterium]
MDVDGISGKLSFFDYKTLTFSTELTDKYAAINKAFKASAELRRGQLTNLSTSSAICFVKAVGDRSLLVMVNPSNKDLTVRTPIVLAGTAMNDLINGGTVNMGVTVDLPPYGYTILAN